MSKNLFVLSLVVFSSFGSAIGKEPVPYGVFQELPKGEITPQGWMAEVLRRQRDGLALNRKASGYPYDTDLWVGKLPKGQWKDYEQTAYFLDGAYRCGLLLEDKALTDLALSNIDYVLEHPKPNGKLGPTDKEFNRKLKPDEADGPTSTGEQWPFAVFTRLLMAHYSATGDQRVIEGLTQHYLALPENFGLAPRDGLNIEGICWLYEQTGDKRMLEIAQRTWANLLNGKITNPSQQYNLEVMASSPKMRGHGVTVSEMIKLPALLYRATGDKKYLEASLGAFNGLRRDHEQVDGVLSSDAVLSGKAPDHSHETCVIVDYTWSLGYLLMATGDSQWADAIERGVLNAGMSVIDRDFKSHQYYSAPNQMAATQTSSHPSNGNRARPWQMYRPDHLPACCTGNVQRMIPTYVERMWMSDGQGGLAAVLYGPATVTTKVGREKTPVTIQQKTDFPFQGNIELKIETASPVEFPLYLRIPGWAEGAKVSVNGETMGDAPKAGSFFKLERKFADGDTVKLELPMPLRLENPVEDAVSVVRGPLLYALSIKETRQRVDDTLVKNPDFPAWNISPGSPWNYSLDLKGSGDLEKIKVSAQPVTDFPWTQEASPVKLTVPARRVPAWVATPENENPPLPTPPIALAKEAEQVELIPYGAAQLRVTVFPENNEAKK